MDNEVVTWSATRLAAAIRSGQLSSRELLDMQMSRLAAINPTVNAVVTLDVERASAAAGAADDAGARGDWQGPLHGLPITIKDAIEVGGMRSTGGAVELSDHIPLGDAPAVSALRRAGAIVMGKTNVPRWSSDVQTYNEIFGTTNNPWALDRVPGGSSGGAAAAVACGMSAFELGTDIGGSVRVPSHCCGVFGLKPSFGVIPQRGYLDHVGGGATDADINVFGPLARSAEDLALLLDVLGGPDPDRALAWRLALPEAKGRQPADYRVGLWLEETDAPIDAQVHAILLDASARLADASAKVEDAHPAVSFADQRDLFFTMITAAVSPSMPNDTAEVLSGSHRAWLAADERRAKLRAIWAEWFETFDILLCPVMPVPAFLHQQEGDVFTRTISINGQERPYLDLVAWAGVIGVLGLPSAVPPLAVTGDGLPVGIQVVAPYLRDRDAIRVAGLLAEVAGGGYHPPPGM